MKTTIAIIIFMLGFQLIWGQTEKSFPQFTWKDTNITEKDGSRFGYDNNSFTPIFKSCHSLPDSYPCFETDEFPEVFLLGKYKNASMNEYVYILYTPGWSFDPLFGITDKNGKLIWSEGAEEMCINSNGIIYVSGNINKMFNQRMKFKLENGKVTEIKQPFYYVDVKGKLLKPVKLYSEKNNQGELVATLPAGYEIEILLADRQKEKDENGNQKLTVIYLARTAFGLVVWLKLTDDDTYYMSPIVK